MRDFTRDHRALSINTATVRKQGDLVAITEACARAEIKAISPWRDQVAAVGLNRAVRRREGCGARALRLLPRRHVPGRCGKAAGGDRRQPPRGGRGGCARRTCLVLVVGGLPQYSRPGSEASKDIDAARAHGRGRDRRRCSTMPQGRSCRSPSSRCIRCMRRTAPA